MIVGGTWLFPPGRALGGWWRDLSPRRPQRLWFTHLLLHRVEALAEVKHAHRLDPVQNALLCLLAGPATVVPEQLRVDRQLLARWLHALIDQGLVRSNGQGWEPTDAGQTAARTGAFTQPGRERRTFYFVDQREAQRPAHFLHLARPALPYPTPAADWHFDPSWLEDCPRRPAEWKRTHQFPADVEAIIVGPPDHAIPSWREVVLDRPEHLPVAIVRTAGGVQGFQTQAEDWKLRADEPVFALGDDWEAVLPDLAAEPPPDAWRSAWQAWCRQRGVPPVDADLCSVERRDHYLEVRAPKRVADRLKAMRGDGPHSETWLLAGTGRTRAAVCLKVVEGGG